VHDNNLHLKLLKAAPSINVAPAPPRASAAPKRKREALGTENAPTNVKRSNNSSRVFDTGAQGASASPPTAVPAAVATTAPVRAVRARAKKTGSRFRPRKVIRNKRISVEVTPTEVGYIFIFQ